jgi:serine/threonine protein kinase
VKSDFASTIAVDVWAIGEILHRMLTTTPSFMDPRLPISEYVARGLEFPTSLLDAAQVSPEGVDCIRLMMAASPRARVTTTAALEHTWLKDVWAEDGSESSSTQR